MASKNVSIKIKADSSSATKNIDKATSSLNKLGKEAKSDSLSKLSNSWKSASQSIKTSGLGLIIAAEVKLLKAELKAIKDTAEAFNVQLKTETQLAQAAKNNPYIDGSGIKRLKEYASQLQTISDYGDEELIPMMTQLVSAGRTESQVMDIMSASIDVAAGSGKSLQSVIENLNKSYSGETGELKNLSAEVGKLTKEQLQHGDAVKILKEQYAGIAEEATNATGSAKQLQMAQDDLAESFGKISKASYDLWNNFWLKTTKRVQKIIEYLDIGLRIQSETLSWGGEYRSNKDFVDTVMQEAAKAEKDGVRQEYLESNVAIQSDEAIGSLIRYLSRMKKRNSEETEFLNILKEEQKSRENSAKKAELQAKAAEKVAAMTTEELQALKEKGDKEWSLDNSTEWFAERNEVLKEVARREEEEAAKQKTLLDTYNNTVDANQKEIDIRKEAGSEISRETELQEMLNTKLDAYVKYVQGGGDTSSKAAKAIREDIKAISAEIAAAEDAEEKRRNAEAEEEARLKAIKDQLDTMNEKVLSLKESANELINGPKEIKLSDTIKDAIATLETEAEQLDKTSEAYQEYIEKLKELKDLLPQVEDAENNVSTASADTLTNVSSVMAQVTTSLQSLSNSISQICNQALSDTDKQYEKEADSLETQLDQNIITYDEYLEKKNALDKEQAQKEYRIKMAEWTMNLAVATAQAAQAVINALASGTPPLNIINATTAGLLGAAQVVAIAGSKPVAPSFSTGGFLTGNSYHGDKIAFNGNAGEAILNPAEQRAFIDLANGKGGNGVVVNMPVNIENNAGNDVQITAIQQDRQIKITVDKIVNSSMQSGGYNSALQSANSSMKGARYL